MHTLTSERYLTLLEWEETTRWIKTMATFEPRVAQRLAEREKTHPGLWARQLEACTVLTRYFHVRDHITQCAELGCPDDICFEQDKVALEAMCAALTKLGVTMRYDGSLIFDGSEGKTPTQVILEECGVDNGA